MPYRSLTQKYLPGVSPSASNAGKWRSSQFVTIAAALFGGFLLVKGVLLFRSIMDGQENSREVVESYDVLRRAETISSLFKDLHIGNAGYLLTGQTEYLAPIDSAESKIFIEIDELIKIVSDNKDQQARARRLREMTDQFLTLHGELMRTRNAKGIGVATKSFTGGRSKALYNMMQRVIADLTEEERRNLKNRLRAANVSELSVNQSVLSTTIGNFVLVLLTGWFMRRYMIKQDEDRWAASGYALIADTIRDETTEEGLCETIIAELAKQLDASVANIYTVHGKVLKRAGSFGASMEHSSPEEIQFGEGLVGESARHLRLIQLNNLPHSHLSIRSSTGASSISSILIFPVMVHGQLIAVIELGSLTAFKQKHVRLLRETGESIGAAIESAAQQTRLNTLLTTMEFQTTELATKEEFLRETNKELEQQAKVLESQKETLADRNRELEMVRSELEKRAIDLEKAGTYKSEFLANMSHELRTPLNSLLILASLLLENKNKNLSSKELEFLKTIHRSGNDLLALINDILDLSKVAAGKLEVIVEDVLIHSLAEAMSESFKTLAEEKGLEFNVEICPDAPLAIRSDGQRIEQVLRNFLSNAIKFTHRGRVSIIFERSPLGGVDISVEDSGIGIPEDKLDVIFEAFQQVDGSTSRRFGGTGLGLTISRDLADLLGGAIHVTSSESEGSCFTLSLPLEVHLEANQSLKFKEVGAQPAKLEGVAPFAHVVRRDEEDLSAAKLPDFASPDDPYFMKNLRQVGDVLRSNLSHSRPVFSIRAPENSKDVSLHVPADKKILIVDDDMRSIYAMKGAMEMRGVGVVIAKNGKEAVDALRSRRDIALVLMDMIMPVMDGFEAIEEIRKLPYCRDIPIISLTSQMLSDESEKASAPGANDCLMKPVEISRLISQMNRWLEVSRGDTLAH